VVNDLCDKALMAAYLRDSDEVAWRDMRRAAREMRRLLE
jgi:general secretion pathway protein A